MQEYRRQTDERFAHIAQSLERHTVPPGSQVREILAKAEHLRGLGPEEALALCGVTDPELLHELYETARSVRNAIYGNRIVLFAPLYVSNLCNNECLYCAFRRSNRQVLRKEMRQTEIAEEVQTLLDQGHKRILLVAGESHPERGLQYIVDCMRTIYATKTPTANIRRVNVNIAPLSVDEFKILKNETIGTYQIFQETYDKKVYQTVHVSGRKRDYHWRLGAMDRAFAAGLKDLGIGVLLGLADWRYEVLALLNHIEHLETTYGVGPHTISVPRLEPALGSELSACPPCPVSDTDFKKIIAILRLAVPYTGIILSTRENAQVRRQALNLGVSQISAGSRTSPGGYRHRGQAPDGDESGQFSLGDKRPMLEVVKEMVSEGYIPSFCTACYRKGRVGKDFMDLAKPGLIKRFCLPNALFTFTEYMDEFGDAQLKQAGLDLTNEVMASPEIPEQLHAAVAKNLYQIGCGQRDIYF